MAYSFDDITFDPDAAALTRAGEAVPLEPQVAEVLAYLIARRDSIVSKDELIEQVWAGRIVSDAALNTRIKDIRRALGDNGRHQKYIRTFPKRGVRFVGELTEDTTAPVSRVVRRPLRSGQWLGVVAGLALVVAILFSALRENRVPLDYALPLPARPSIAVLPFERLDEATDAFVATGLTEDIIWKLSLYRELFVISRNTAFALGQSDPREVAEQLGVAFVARGSVRTVEDTLRIRAELVDSSTGEALWAERFLRPAADIFAVQEEISAAIAGRLAPEIAKASAKKLSRHTTDNLSAWDLFIRAKAAQSVYSRDTQERAIALATAAIDKDPQFAAAHSLIARAKGAIFFFGWSDDPDLMRRDAIAFAKRALELDADDPVAYAALGYVYRFTGDEARAIPNLERAVQLNPNDAMIRLELAHTLDWFRHQTRALPHIEAAIRLSPRDPFLQNMYFYKAHILFHLDRFEESLAAAQQMASVLSSKTWEMLYNLMRASALAELGRDVEAGEAIAAAIEVRPGLTLSGLRAQFDRSNNHPDNRANWLASLRKAGLSG